MANKVTITISQQEAGLLDLLLKTDAQKMTEESFTAALVTIYGYSRTATKAYVAEQLLLAIKV